MTEEEMRKQQEAENAAMAEEEQQETIRRAEQEAQKTAEDAMAEIERNAKLGVSQSNAELAQQQAAAARAEKAAEQDAAVSNTATVAKREEEKEKEEADKAKNAGADIAEEVQRQEAAVNAPVNEAPKEYRGISGEEENSSASSFQTTMPEEFSMNQGAEQPANTTDASYTPPENNYDPVVGGFGTDRMDSSMDRDDMGVPETMRSGNAFENLPNEQRNEFYKPADPINTPVSGMNEDTVSANSGMTPAQAQNEQDQEEDTVFTTDQTFAARYEGKTFWKSDQRKKAWEEFKNAFDKAQTLEDLIIEGMFAAIRMGGRMLEAYLDWQEAEGKGKAQFIKESKKAFVDSMLVSMGQSQSDFDRAQVEFVYGSMQLHPYLEKNHPNLMAGLPKDPETGFINIENCSDDQKAKLADAVVEFAQTNPELRNGLQNMMHVEFNDEDIQKYANGLRDKLFHINDAKKHQGMGMTAEPPHAPDHEAEPIMHENVQPTAEPVTNETVKPTPKETAFTLDEVQQRESEAANATIDVTVTNITENSPAPETMASEAMVPETVVVTSTKESMRLAPHLRKHQDFEQDLTPEGKAQKPVTFAMDGKENTGEPKTPVIHGSLNSVRPYSLRELSQMAKGVVNTLEGIRKQYTQINALQDQIQAARGMGNTQTPLGRMQDNSHQQ